MMLFVQCAKCRHVINAVGSIQNNELNEGVDQNNVAIGSFVFCSRCLSFSRFDDNMLLKPATNEDVDLLLSHNPKLRDAYKCLKQEKLN